MSSSAEHYFWQERVSKEMLARNKYPLISNNDSVI